MNTLLAALTSDNISALQSVLDSDQNVEDIAMALALHLEAKDCLYYLSERRTNHISTPVRSLKYLIDDKSTSPDSIPSKVLKKLSGYLHQALKSEDSNHNQDYVIDPIIQSILTSPAAALWINTLFPSKSLYLRFANSISRACLFKDKSSPVYPSNLIELLTDDKLP